MSKTLSAKTTTTRWQDQHIPARPYGESKSITHANIHTSSLKIMPQTHKHVWTKSVFKNVQLSLLLKESNFSCKSSSSLYFWSSINSCKQERETELTWSQTGIDWVDECLSFFGCAWQKLREGRASIKYLSFDAKDTQISPSLKNTDNYIFLCTKSHMIGIISPRRPTFCTLKLVTWNVLHWTS